MLSCSKLVICFWCVAFMVGVSMCFIACGHGSGSDRACVDSLNTLIRHLKYHSLDEAAQCTDEMLRKYAGSRYQDGIHEAWLNKGDVYRMRMDYDSAQVCYKKVLEESDNDLICGVADVDMMSVCLMTSMSKKFYDYRSDAHERFANVEEEAGDMTEHQSLIWNAVRTEYHFVSLGYFIKMRQEVGMQEEFEWLEKNEDLFVADTTQLSTYLLLKSFYCVEGGVSDDAVDEMQRSLIRLLSISRQRGYIYFEVSALNNLAHAMIRGLELRPSRRVFVEELMGEENSGDFTLILANRAKLLAEKYGNDFLYTTVLVTLSDYYLKEGEDSLSLVQMEQALQLLNQHHQRMCRHQRLHTSEELFAYSVQEDTLSTEMKWIANTSVVTVPEWMAMVREQFSIIYGAMGMKAESDYNHNIYFDILDATRQDLRVQQEEEHLRQEERTLNLLLYGGVLIIVILAWLLYEYYRHSRREYHKKVDNLSQVIDICQHLSVVLSDEIENEEDLDDAIYRIADVNVEKLFPQVKGKNWMEIDTRSMRRLDRELLHVLQSFSRWISQKGLLFLQIKRDMQKMEGETYVFEKRLEEYKRQYMEKLTAMSIVNGITPFLDRALHEVNKMKSDSASSSTAALQERFIYLSELVGKINEYNNVLGYWVKISQGIVTLNIENFALQSLFDTLERGKKNFSIKGLTLLVTKTGCVVKADKSLTLFMMNTLLDNARKYTPSGGRVELCAMEFTNYVEISVIDTGHGMSAEDVDILNNSKVYDSGKIGMKDMYASEIQHNKGFGFGLMNCKGIIEKYKKTSPVFSVCYFGVESEYGKGCRFFFRLLKGVLKTATCIALLWGGMNTSFAAEHDGLKVEKELVSAQAYVDSVFVANVERDYERAVFYADSAIQHLNRYCIRYYPENQKRMQLEGRDMAELDWWRLGYDVDYEMIITLRNEVSIAALALNRNSLYHYNNEVFTRLYKLVSTDPTLEEYSNHIKMTNRNKKTVVILLGIFVFCGVAIYFFLYYRNNQLFIFNLRLFIQLNEKIFFTTHKALPRVLRQSLSDIKATDVVGLMLPSNGIEATPCFVFAGDEVGRSMYESLMQTAYTRCEETQSSDGHFHAYPLLVPDQETVSSTGVLGVCFSDDKLTNEESLIMHLIVQFMGIYTYYSHDKMDEMREILELRQDERMRIENEQQKAYVRNQIMDNSLSTLKHETMYYPTRIKQIVDAVLQNSSFVVSESVIRDIDELMSYYKEIFTILSTCAGKQVGPVLFKRVMLSDQMLVEMAQRSFRRQQEKWKSKARLKVEKLNVPEVQGDKIYIQTLIDNIISLYFEHQSGGDLLLNFEQSGGFAKFVFTDMAYQYTEEDLPLLFYVDNVKYDNMTGRLSGVQYLICRQIIREHDARAAHRGCRIYVENLPDGNGSQFVFTLPMA